MESYLVTNHEMKDGLIFHEVRTEDGKTKTIAYNAIRAGLSWPTAENPKSYYCILGDQTRGTQFQGVAQPQAKLKFLEEKEINSLFLDELFQSLTDACALFGCSTIYTDLSDDFQDNADFFHEWAFKKEIQYGHLEVAAFLRNFPLGLSIIRDWQKNGYLEIPKDSIVRNQLKPITSSDLGPELERMSHAINGVRYCTASFFKYQPSSLVGWTPNRR